MTKKEILVTTTGEMSDMMAALAIYSGSMKPKHKASMEKILFEM